MSSVADLVPLRNRVVGVLRSPACHGIRFQIEGVGIQRFMYSFIADAIRDERVKLHVGSGHHYDPKWNDLTLDSAEPAAYTIVHEATHAVIDATHVGKVFTTGTHEAAAYLAETVYALSAADTGHVLDVAGLGQILYPLARRIQAFNASHPSGLFAVPDSVATSIKDVLQHSNLRQEMSHTEKMDGISQGPRRGLIGRAWLDQKSR